MRIVVSLALLLVSCSPQSGSDPSPTGSGAALDTGGMEEELRIPSDGVPVFARRVAVFMEASSASINALRESYSEEDYAVMADDMMYYRAMAYEYLEQRGVEVIRVAGRVPVGFVVDGTARTFEFSREQSLDLLVLFDPGKMPVPIAPVDIDRAVEYFGLP